MSISLRVMSQLYVISINFEPIFENWGGGDPKIIFLRKNFAYRF
jgi:hypothetical protein